MDCPTLRIFAQGLGMQFKRPTIWTSLLSDCCSASGVTCDGNQRVTEIQWVSMALNGFVNGTAFPSKLETLDLYLNELSGGIPFLSNGIISLDLSLNVLNGSIPTSLPPDLFVLRLYGNRLVGNVPTFPASLVDFYLGFSGYPGNHFSGVIRLNVPSQLFINDNWITDVIIQDSSRLTSGYCDLSRNPLFGNPNIAALTGCVKNGLYSASLLPSTATIKLTATNKLSDIQTYSSVDKMFDIASPTTSTAASTDELSNLSLIQIETNDSRTSEVESRQQDIPVLSVDPFLVYGLLGGIGGLCTLVLAASLVFKHPKMHSKFGRKNSFGTLNTVVTKSTVRSN